MQDWWLQLAPRERILVAVCGVLVVLALIWSLGIQPLYQNTAKLEEQVAEKQGQLANYQELAAQIIPGGNSQSSGQPNSNESIVVIIDRTTREWALASFLKRNQPEGNGNVRLRLEGAPFDKVVEWLGQLNSKYGMLTISANIDEAGEGRVNCSLVLGRAGG
jgi:general secretion pathway protein M